ncbi:AAA ATPase midasin, partial [Coemansia sp. RSA 486]
GLPRSFVNRFTQVFMDELTRSDLHVICDRMHNSHPSVGSVLEFNWRMHNETMVRRSFGASGSPWEFNLRDVSRFMELALEPSALDAQAKPVADFVEMLYVHRMRTDIDRRRVRELYQSVFGLPLPDAVPSLHMTGRLLQVGGAVLPRRSTNARPSRLRALHAQLPYLESLMRCIEKRWMAILVGPAGCGKTSLVRWLATATGNHLVEFSMNAGVDTSEILGGFEQVDLQRHCAALVRLLALISERATLGACFQDSEQASLVASISALYHQAADSNVSVSVLCAVAEDIARLADRFPALNELCARVRTQAQALAALEVAGKFEWVDGVLVDALINGHWLLIDRANLCSASVLDRLNGLLEPNGVLYVNEDPKRTSAVVPHPDFRIIMAVDPLYGELSRAMRNRGVPAKLLQGPAVPESTTTALVQQAMHVAERVQRGYYAASNTMDHADDTLVLLARAPASPVESSASMAAWQTALARLAVSTGSSLASSRMVLAVLATLPPSASAFSTTCLRAITDADPINSALAKLIDTAPAVVAEAISRARQMLAHESGIHVDVLASAPLCIALNSGIQRILERQTQKESSNNLAMLWHQALTDTLVFQHERTSVELSSSAASGLSADLRELVLQRPSVDIAFVQSIFALIDGCQRILDAWEPTVVGASEPEVGSDLAQFVPALRSLHRLKLRIEYLLSLDRGAASELAVAFENLQPVLIHLQSAPGDVGREAAGLLLASVDGLVLDASFSARVWQLQHPVTLADDDARALEQQLVMAAKSLASNAESDPMLRDAVTEALAMLFATASRKDQHLVRAAIRRFAQSLPESSEPSTKDHGALAAPADVITDVVELGHWQRIVHMVAAVASNSAAASDSALFSSLSDLVSTTPVKEGSSWSLLYTRLCWALNDPQQTGAAQLLPLLTDLSHHWFQQLDARTLDTLLTSPDRRLLQPVGTELTWKQAASLDCSLATYERAALHSRQLLASFATYRPFVRSAANELALLVAGVAQTVRAVSSSLSSDCTAELAMRSELLVKALENNTATEEQRHGWLELVRQATASVSDVVSSAIGSVQNALASFSLAAIYRASIQVALCQLAISIPKRPVDPAAKARTQWTWLGDEIEEAQADLDAFQKVQLSMTGESVSAATQPHAQRLSELERAQSGIELVYRPAKSQATASFAELWQEAHNLMANVLGRARDIAAQLVPMSMNTVTDDGDDERFSMSVDEFGRVDAAAQAVLNTLRQFESRVVKRYFSAFRDVAQIWCVQVRQIAYSLMRLVELRRIQANRQTAEYAVLVDSLYAQPMTNVVAVAATGSNNSGELLAHLQTVLAKLKTLIYFTQGNNGGPLKTYGQLLVALLSRVVLAVQVRGALTPHELAALNSVFGDAYDIHKRAVDEKRKREAEAASLFKSKVTKEPTDDELLNELFPGYDDIYEPESEDADDEEKKLEPSYQDLSDEVVAALAACHQYVMLQFGGSMQGASDVRRTLILDAQRQAFELAASLYQLKPEIASIQTARADSELRGANIVSLASVAAATTAATAATAAGDSGVRMVNVYNFYKDPSTSEAVLLKPLVSGIVARVKFLLDEWPEHAVLQQIRDMCERLLEFPVNTPLAKLLAGLELLHQRAQDWQAFASRDVAIEELGDVARLIIRWRQTELNSWPHLLRAQELEFARRPNEWWFGLYAALVVPESAEFNDLVSAIDQFMQGSPAGEYRGRLNMLCAFAGHRMAVLAAQAQQQGHSLALLQQKDSVYGPLTNAIDYYAQFASCIHDHLERAGKSIRKDLAQYVKISSWKDVNPAALRASAQKTHRHLTKCIKMWREALSQPIFQIIQLQQTASIATARVPLVQIVPLPLNNAGFDIEPPRSIAAMSGGRTLALPWTISDDLDISPELAASVARMASSTSMARVLEASPSTLQQLVRMMTRSTVFYAGNATEDSSSSSSSNIDVLEEFALQIVGDVNYFQSVETPKHLVKPSSTKTASSKPSQQQQTASASSKKLLIKSKKQRESEQEAAAEYIEDDDERQRRIKQFWGEQRNLRRTRLKEILKAMQELGLKRHFRATAAAAQQDSTAKGSSLIGLSAMLQQAPLDVAAWHQAAAASLAVESSSVHAHTPEAHRNWQLANAGFFRLCSQLAQLRSASFEEHSQEVNGQQVMQIISLMESLAHNVAGDRRCAAELLANAAGWMQASIGWTATPMASEDVTIAEPTVEQLKDSVDALVSLMHQFVVSARAVDDVGGWGANAALVGQAIGAASSAADRLTKAAGSLAVVNSAFVSLKLAGVQPVCALAQLQQLRQTEDARKNVREAVVATQQALAAIAESGLDPWVLAPWIDPISRAAEQLAEATIATPPEPIQENNAAPEPLVAHLAELSGQLATGTMHAWQAIHRAEKQFAEYDAEPNQWGLAAKELVHRLELMNQMARALHLPKMIELCCSLSNAVHLATGNTSAYVGEIYRLVRGWMTRYSLIVQHVVALYARWHRTLVQFALTSTGVLTTVIVHGLGTNDIYDSEETDESMQNGMGVGEGSTAGAKNVSDEIESEDQVEGLQGEEPDTANEPQTNEDAIDMENDFEGKLGDADLETDNEDSDKDDDDDEEQEMDEQLGDVDPTDPTALDDKLWDDDDEEKDPKDEKGEDNNKVDSKAKSKKEQTDIVAGDEEEDNDKSNDPDAAGDQAEGDDEEEQNGSGSDGSDGEDEDEGDDLDDGVNKDTFDRMADVEDQGEQLDMPEDLDMGSDNDGDDAQSDEEDDGLDADMNDLPEDEPIERKPDALDEEQAEDAENDGKDDATEGQEADERADDQDDVMDQDEISGEDDEAVDGAGEDVASDEEQGQGEEDEEEAGRGDDSEEAAKDETEDAEESGANKPTDGVDSAMNLDGNDDADPNTTAESNDALSKPSQTTDSNQKQQQQPATSAMQQESFMQQEDSQQQNQQQQQPDEQQKRDLNPERTLADVIEKWERRLNIVMREKEEEKDEQPGDSESQDEQKPNDADEQMQMHQDKNAPGNEDDQAAPESTDFEHVKQDEDFDKVALADADKHDKEEQQQHQQHQPMDVDEEEEGDVDDNEDSEMKDADEADDQAAGSNAAARPAMMQAAPQQLPATNNDGESAAEAAQMEQSNAEEDRREHADDSMAMETDDQEAVDEQPAVDVDRLRDELEQRTADWRANKQDSEQAVELWQSYTRLTHDLSLMLTEQLRLILTPTQATQLRGDYRTGKRLNMKRIIPYIASEFRKDKIWLRRTKPARREYQVMVAVDNSKSMAQNTQAVELAYETLALVTTALNQLEVGQLSVVSFGEQVSLLHPFDTAFDSEAGARVLSRFTFADDKTDVVQLMDATLQLFASAAMHGSSSAASDLWRLQLVISDGVCQDHPRLLRQVRAAMEMRIMTVFIVLDRSAIATNAVAEALDPEKDSIMHTQHVSFVKGPSGKTEMKVQRYLDTFPFKYYVVLRNIHGLPAVLAETLRHMPDSSQIPIYTLAEQWLSQDRTRAQIETLVDSKDEARLEQLLRNPVEFGTAGLRARMEAGYSRLNKATIITASQGLSAYVEREVKDACLRGVVVGHDHRHNSAVFAQLAVRAFLDRGFKVYFYPGLSFTPQVPFAVKHLGAACGVMITASHNPKDDNGYKVYWENGAQIKPPLDVGIAKCIQEHNVPKNWDISAVAQDLNVVDVSASMLDAYVEATKVHVQDIEQNRRSSLQYVYTPMHGVGAPFAKRIIEAFGLPAYVPVPEQLRPDPDFPTVAFPNPEEKGALEMAKAAADSRGIGLVVANDPDADRFAAAEKQQDGSWLAFTGDQLGTIFAAAVLENTRRQGIPDAKVAMVNSTVSSRMLEAMAHKDGFHYADTLTGFKWMANELASMEQQGYHIGFGYEEAIGYMIGDPVLDKDGISALAVFLQLAAGLHSKGKRVADYLEEQYARYGYFVSSNLYFICPDPAKTNRIFSQIRFGSIGSGGSSLDAQQEEGDVVERTEFVRPHCNDVLRYPRTIGGFPVSYIRDLTVGFEMRDVDKHEGPLTLSESQFVPEFPVSAGSHMITFETRNGGRLTMRTSGTEPKLKYYLEVRNADNDRQAAARDLQTMVQAIADELVQAKKNGL